MAWSFGMIAVSCAQIPTPTLPAADTEAATANETVELTVSAAASVQDAMKEVQSAYQAENPAVVLTYNFGASGSLAQQITQGAPTDIFLSASQQWMDDLEAKGQLLADSRQDLLRNSLVLIVPQGTTGITDLNSFATDAVSKLAIGEPESTPVGRYAKEALASLGLFDDLQSKMVFGKDVRQVLSYVETGNVNAGLVYATDAKISERVQVVATVPADLHSPIIYPVGVVADSENAEAAQAFIDFLASDTAAAIFAKYGFDRVE
ncbi:MAG: molybdate ABC transporter substrate-binding protein [Spirulinaceae cyanobacterium RM2_2_10]|nr:molybdate ABC transporter substrate-binding protein [Spirulinaceae cyanobacterium SM2_1_0]NJO19674.1 molybdate ABC transporter substrate-binding protein [Spirulinaceae cyanobacterium RM2_2_10]